MSARLVPHVLGMALLGLGSLAVFYGLVEWRIAHAPVPESAAAGASRARHPLEALAAGTQASLALARQNLESDRGEAVPSLDAAKRAAQAGSEAGSPAFAQAHRIILRARRSLANGDLGPVLTATTEASEALERVAGEPTTSRVPPLGGYAGATLLDRYGRRIGKVEGVGQDGKSLRLETGGRSEEVPAQELVLGKPKTIGSTFVALVGR